MNFDAIKTVVDAENNADDLHVIAERDAEALKYTARTEGEKKVADAISNAQATVDEKIDLATRSGEEAAVNIEKAALTNIAELEKSASANMEKAVSIILEKIMV